MFKTAAECMDYVRSKEIYFYNFMYVDACGQARVTTKPAKSVTEQALTKGIVIDQEKHGSCAEAELLLLRPELEAAFVDPYSAYPTITLMCNLVHHNDAKCGAKCEFDPRFTAEKANDFMVKSGVADYVSTCIEIQFHVFDGMRCSVEPHNMSYHVQKDEGDKAFGAKREYGNLGHRPHNNGGYHAQQPMDSFFDLRTEITENMRKMGLTPTGHHHGAAMGQCQVDFTATGLLRSCDNIMQAKYLTRATVASYGKTATFMPVPFGQPMAASGLSIGISMWKNNKNVSHGKDIGNFFIGGLMQHMGAIAAFTNPTTNSYRRFKDGALGQAIVSTADTAMINCIFPDPTANPYLAYAAIMAAGMDGIANSISPPKPGSNNMPRSLSDALDNLERGSAFLLAGNIFTKDQIGRYAERKHRDVQQLESMPHPWEYFAYYSY